MAGLGYVGVEPLAVLAASTGSETYTLGTGTTAGSVVSIAGATLDGVPLSVSSLVLIKDAPASSGVGSAGSSQPGNGFYQVSAVTSAISLTRYEPMGGDLTPTNTYAFVQEGTVNAGTGWCVPDANTVVYGTSAIQFVAFAAPGPDLITKNSIATLTASTTPNQASVIAQLNNMVQGGSQTPIADPYAPLSWISAQYAALAPSAGGVSFGSSSYPVTGTYQATDAACVPATVLGVRNVVNGVYSPLAKPANAYYGVASLNASGQIPVAQLPPSGAGYLIGPYGPTAIATSLPSTIGATPVRIADWAIGAADVAFQPWMFAVVACTANMGLPVLELTMSDVAPTGTPPPYPADNPSPPGIRIGLGLGRSMFNGLHAVTAVSSGNELGQTPTTVQQGQTSTSAPPGSFPAGYNVWVTAWLYDAYASDLSGSSVSMTLPGGFISGALYLLRTTE